MKRTNKNTIGFWVKHFGYVLEWWDIGVNKWTGQASVEIRFHDPADVFNCHTFDF